jgi:hypothetical protein
VYLVNQLLDNKLFLLKQPLQLLYLLSSPLDLQLVGIILHVGQVTLLATTLLGLEPFLAPVTLEEALFEERLPGLPTLILICFDVGGGMVTVDFAYGGRELLLTFYLG